VFQLASRQDELFYLIKILIFQEY